MEKLPLADKSIVLLTKLVAMVIGAYGFKHLVDSDSENKYLIFSSLVLMGIIPADILAAMIKKWMGLNGNGNGNGNGNKK